MPAGWLWRWLDAHGAKFGLYRPMPGVDPAHVQSKGEWRRLAQSMRLARTRVAESPAATAKAAAGKTKVVAADAARR